MRLKRCSLRVAVYGIMPTRMLPIDRAAIAIPMRADPQAVQAAELAAPGTSLALVAGAMGGAGCDVTVYGALFVGAVVTVALVIQLPKASPIALLPAVLLPTWLSCGSGATVAIALAAGLAGGAIRTRAARPTVHGAIGVLGGVVLGSLAAAAFATSGLLDVWWGGRLFAGAAFMISYWFGERGAGWAAERLRLPEGLRNAPRSSLLANLLLVVPGVVLADVLETQGLPLFGAILFLHVAVLGLTALYCGAETARRGMAAEQARLQAIVANAAEGMFAVGPDLTLQWLNETAGRMVGRGPQGTVGRLCDDVIRLRRPNGALADHAEAFARAARSDRAVYIRGKLQTPDGRVRPAVVSYTAVPDRADGIEVGIGVVREDVPSGDGDGHEADLGHELRSPLSSILGFARLLSMAPTGVISAADQAEFIGRISESGDYMLRLVNNLLDLHEMEAGVGPLQLTQVRLDAFLRSALSMIQPQADEKGIATSLEVEPDLPQCVTDELLARRAIDNLLSNAIKYTPRGGSVWLSASRDGEGVAIACVDTGIGLTDEDQARLFDRFFRGSRREARRERGTGLGLALVHEAARRLGGEVRVSSAVGRGTTFTLWLPFRAEAIAAPQEIEQRYSPIS